MRFFEAGKIYEDIPYWVRFLLDFGYKWSSSGSGRRRICLVSMPCESVGAGFMALGAMRRGLEEETANDVDLHFHNLQKFRRSFLRDHKNCQECKRSENGLCDDCRQKGMVVKAGESKKWIFSSEDNNFQDGGIAVRDAVYRKYIIRNGRKIENQNRPAITWINRSDAGNWYKKGFPAMSAKSGSGLDPSRYSILPEWNKEKIIPDNVSTSYGGLLLVGGAKEKNSIYMQAMESVKFCVKDNLHSLLDLIALDIHSAGSISRVGFSRVQDMDNKNCEPALIVADGLQACRSVMTSKKYTESDVIGIYDRCSDAENMAKLRVIMAEKARDYQRAENQPEGLPCGIFLTVLERG